MSLKKNMICSGLLVVGLGLPACGSKKQKSGLELFPTDRVVEISLDLPPESVESLRVDADRSKKYVVRGMIQFGQQKEMLVGVRIKGQGSRRAFDSQPSFKIKVNAYIKGQRLGNKKSLTLNNMIQDSDKVSECVGYEIMEKFGFQVPKCSYAYLTVNGEPKGLYTHIESLDDVFAEERLGDGVLMEADLPHTDLGGAISRGYLPKTHLTQLQKDVLASIRGASDNHERFLDTLSPYMDLDHALKFIATEVLLGRWDGYTSNGNNHYLFIGTSGALTFIPSGLDGIMPHRHQNMSIYGLSSADRPGLRQGFITESCLALVECKKRYHEILAEVVNTFSEEEYLAIIRNKTQLIKPFLSFSPFWETNEAGVKESIGKLEDYFPARIESIRGQLEISKGEGDEG